MSRLYFKRVMIAQQMFGDAGFHSDRLGKKNFRFLISSQE